MTKIQWTEQTWNPIVGCSIVSSGCTNCYAMSMAWRLGHMKNTPQYNGLTKKVNGNAVWTGKMALAEKALLNPLKRKKPTMYFVNSMGDLFHENVPDEWIDRVFAVMALCPQHTFQVLTKRADRMRDYMKPEAAFSRVEDIAIDLAVNEPIGRILIAPNTNTNNAPKGIHVRLGRWPLPNVWLGVSVEDQTRADERIPLLLDTPATVRFISAEPLLGAVDLNNMVQRNQPGEHYYSALTLDVDPEDDPWGGACIDWVICGGESGKDARAMHPDWARSLRDQCQVAGAPFFFKQWGEWGPDLGPDVHGQDLIFGDNMPCAWHDGAKWKFEKNGFNVNLKDATGHGQWVYRLGSKCNGNLLDGWVWDEMAEGCSDASEDELAALDEFVM